MKKRPLPVEKMFSKKVIKANETSFDILRKYQRTIEAIDKVRFPFGKGVAFKEVAANTTDLPMNIYGSITTG